MSLSEECVPELDEPGYDSVTRMLSHCVTSIPNTTVPISQNNVSFSYIRLTVSEAHELARMAHRCKRPGKVQCIIHDCVDQKQCRAGEIAKQHQPKICL
jgi:hypothetical protein